MPCKVVGIRIHPLLAQVLQTGHIKEAFLRQGIVFIVHAAPDFELYTLLVKERILKGRQEDFKRTAFTGVEGVRDRFIKLFVL